MLKAKASGGGDAIAGASFNTDMDALHRDVLTDAERAQWEARPANAAFIADVGFLHDAATAFCLHVRAWAPEDDECECRPRGLCRAARRRHRGGAERRQNEPRRQHQPKQLREHRGTRRHVLVEVCESFAHRLHKGPAVTSAPVNKSELAQEHMCPIEHLLEVVRDELERTFIARAQQQGLEHRLAREQRASGRVALGAGRVARERERRDVGAAVGATSAPRVVVVIRARAVVVVAASDVADDA